MRGLKIVIVGDSQVGKTSLLISFTTKGYCNFYYPNVFNIFSVRFTRGSSTDDLEIWDTSGDVCEFSARPDVHLGTNVYLLCFELDNIASYHSVKTKWYPELYRCSPEVPIVLVGTQMDLRISDDPHMFVTKQMGGQLKKEINACAYVECSALEETGVDMVFGEAIRCARLTSQHTLLSGDMSRGKEGLRSWLASYSDACLYEQARGRGAGKADLTSRLGTAIYLHRLQSGHTSDYSPPGWVMTGTEADRQLFSFALADGARSSDLLLKNEAHRYVDAMRAAGLKVTVPPSWVTDCNTLNTFNEAVAKKISPPLLNSRADTELFLLNIEDVDKYVSCLPWGMFG